MAETKLLTKKKTMTIMASSLSIRINPLQTLKSSLSLLAAIFFLVFFSNNVPSATSTLSSQPLDFEPLYDNHCNHYVPKSPLNGIQLESSAVGQTLPFTIGYFTGGDLVPGQNPSAAGDLSTLDPRSASFLPGRSFYATESQGIYKLQGILRFMTPLIPSTNHTNRGLREIRFRAPRFPIRRGNLIAFRLDGFWSESSGKLCMVGSSYSFANTGQLRSFNAVLKLNYPNSMNTTVVDSVVGGSLVSLDPEGNSNHFNPVSLLGVPDHSQNYVYTLMNKVDESDFFGGYNDSGVESLSPSSYSQNGLCSMLLRENRFLQLEYGSDCDRVNCNPAGSSVGFLPDMLRYNVIECSGKNHSRMLLGFVKSSYTGFKFPFNPNTTLVAEGTWDESRNQLYAVGCRILTSTESLGSSIVGDCSIKLSLRFPAVFSLRNRNVMEGQIWSDKNVNDSGYFGKILFKSHRTGFRSYIPGLKYKYTVVERVNKLRGAKGTAKRKGRTYPNGYSSDMKFDMTLTNRKGKTAQGFSSPLFVGNQLYAPNSFVVVEEHIGSAVQVNNNSSLMNISYKMTLPLDFMLGSNISLAGTELSAEGTYDTETGILCMIGCWVVRSNTKSLRRNKSVDCEILVNVRFPAVNGKGAQKVKGTIESMRGKYDPLYFEVLELSSNSILTSQAEESIWRMDFEITMVLISNTCACLFVAMQLFYVKRHPEALPFISVVMVALLTLGHMIPLLLNFEALFVGSHDRQDVFLGSGGWLAVNEVIVRVVTMVAFLLEFHLLQQTWFSRQGEGNQNGLWASERKVFYILLPLYIAGGLVAWFVHQSKTSHQSLIKRIGYVRTNNQAHTHQKIPIWGDVRSYSGLILDAFLLPQILLNLLSNSRENALGAPFYIGTSIVRLLPHAYDLYRAHSYAWYLDLSYIYANHIKDFYSTFWNIVIPIVGLLFATVIYLQQRFGGRCILPKRFRGSSVYEKLPISNGEELQELSNH